METRNFEEDLKNSNNPILRLSWEKLLKTKFGNDVEITWKDSREIQNIGADLVIKTGKGRRYSIETKTRNNKCFKDPNWMMEIVSHVYNKEEKPRVHLHSKEGWIYTTTAEYILHGTLNKEGTEVIEAIFYSLIPFKTEKYKSGFNNHQKLFLPTLFSNGSFQLTLNKLIPLEVIKRDALEFWQWEK